MLTALSLQSPDGRVTQGYFITAYRNLTSVSANAVQELPVMHEC